MKNDVNKRMRTRGELMSASEKLTDIVSSMILKLFPRDPEQISEQAAKDFVHKIGLRCDDLSLPHFHEDWVWKQDCSSREQYKSIAHINSVEDAHYFTNLKKLTLSPLPVSIVEFKAEQNYIVDAERYVRECERVGTMRLEGIYSYHARTSEWTDDVGRISFAAQIEYTNGKPSIVALYHDGVLVQDRTVPSKDR